MTLAAKVSINFTDPDNDRNMSPVITDNNKNNRKQEVNLNPTLDAPIHLQTWLF